MRFQAGKAVFALALALPLAGRCETFLLLEGQPGPVTEKNHPGWIAVDSFTSGHQIAAAAKAKPSFTDFTFTRNLDQASPALYRACAAGTIYKSARFEVVRNGDAQVQLYEVILTGARVAGVNTGGSDSVPMEMASLAFDSIQWTYTKVDFSGKPTTRNRAAWNLKTGLGSFTELMVSTSAPADADHDGMPDAWERRHGLNPLVNDAQGDFDGDGMTNLQEFLIGTLPEQADATFRAQYSATPGLPARLSWGSLAGKIYQVFAAATVDGSYTLFRTVTAAAGFETVLEIPASEARQFFRVDVQ